MKQLCFSFYNVNILQLNVAIWAPFALRTWCSVSVAIMHLLHFQLDISEMLQLC